MKLENVIVLINWSKIHSVGLHKYTSHSFLQISVFICCKRLSYSPETGRERSRGAVRTREEYSVLHIAPVLGR